MARPAILLAGKIHLANDVLDDLRKEHDILDLVEPDRQSFLKACADGKRYAHVVALYHTFGITRTVGNFDTELIESLPASVKYICHNGAGYDMITAIDACTARGIQVSNTPIAVDDATATTAIFLLISALRHFSEGEASARQGNWAKGFKPGRDPEGKTLGILGMGGIGKATARRAAAFDMEICYHNRNRIPDADLRRDLPGIKVTYCATVEELCKTSDVVSVHIPLNDQTRGSFGRKEFSWMKEGSALINTARGAVIDEEALLEALQNGQLASAGLDVFPAEPTINPSLLANPRVTVLPHLGTATTDTMRKMEIRVLDNIKHAFKTGEVIDHVSEQKDWRKS
ncbi:uncharacterized protein L969DRAFT_19614 [Mixia osmundae IAM 14324]|nr:uncharacterized protein L969DRAFT_19614 [Mixia osmundae IAM 14324]KEI37066.1 hypothetical protein L969DRAFT_19614 [Mixia osmundae IAM 14324]